MLDIVKNRTQIPDSRYSAYCLPIFDGTNGHLHDYITGNNATLYGGSTQSNSQMKFWDDFQFLGIPGSEIRGFRASAATTNLLAGLPKGYHTVSAEGGRTDGGDWLYGPFEVVDTWAKHGQKSFRIYRTSPLSDSPYIDITSLVTPGNTYTASAWLRPVTGVDYGVLMIIDYDGATFEKAYGNYIPVGAEGYSVVTKTIRNPAVWARVYYGRIGASYPTELYIDAVQLVEGSTPLPFVTQEATASYASVPTPFSAGEPFTALFLVWTPWAGNDGVHHDLAYTYWTTNGFRIFKSTGNSMEFRIYDAAGNDKKKIMAVDAATWPVGFNAVSISRDSAGNLKLCVNGTLAVASGGSGTGLEGATVTPMQLGASAGIATLNGLILPFFWRGYAAGDEELKYLSSLKGLPSRYIRW